ncbi:MAG TPA: hypothetical protein VJ828_05465 [Lacipirellulaceae bacterium]|nr:hypothetical protein [Lacipirellulaceae bacterium]
MLHSHRLDRLALVLVTWLIFATPIPAIAQHIFWSDGLRNQIWTASFNGANPHAIISNLPTSPESIAIDRIERKVYWTLDGTVNQIRRANLDGTNAETVLDNGTRPNAIAIDVPGRKMYFGSDESLSIHRANLDGSSPQLLTTFPGDGVTSIAVDSAAGQLYWTVENAADLYRSNLDGTNAGLLIDGPSPIENFGRLESVFVDPHENRLYLNDEDDSRIFSMPLPEGILTQFVPEGLMHPRDMTIDVAGRRLYWTQAGGIFRAQLDGSGAEPVVSGLTDALGFFPLAIAVIPEPASVLMALAGLASCCAFIRTQRTNSIRRRINHKVAACST